MHRKKCPIDWQSKASGLESLNPVQSLVSKLDQEEKFSFPGCRWPDPCSIARWMNGPLHPILPTSKSWIVCDPDSDSSFKYSRPAPKQSEKSVYACSYPATIHFFVKAAQSESLPSIKKKWYFWQSNHLWKSNVLKHLIKERETWKKKDTFENGVESELRTHSGQLIPLSVPIYRQSLGQQGHKGR